MIKAQVDWENNSGLFWDAFHERFPAKQDIRGVYEFTEEEWEEVVNLPGWDDSSSPDYAPHPLIVE